MRAILATLLIMLTQLISSRTIFVAEQGNDDNPGTRALPYANINKACVEAVAGDTVIIREGYYPVSREVRPLHSGKPNKWITYMVYEGEKALIDGQNFLKDTSSFEGRTLYRKGLLHIEGVSYIRFENIMVKNSHNVGIYVKGPGTSNIELVDCKTDETYNSGIGIWYADSVLVKGCEITNANNQDMRPAGFPLRREAPHEALTLAGATNFIVTENHIHSCYKEGIDCKEVSSHGVIFNNYIHDLPRQGLYVDCWFGLLEDVEIHSNIVHDCEWGAAISGEGKNSGMKNIRLHHNILYDNRASGILFGVWGHDVLRQDIYIYNNTVHNNGTPGHWAGATGGIDVRSANLENVHIFNNITSFNYAFEIGTFASENPEETLEKKNIFIRNNLIADFDNKHWYDGFFNKKVYAYNGESSIMELPMYENPWEGDFSLKNCSVAIGAGITVDGFGSKDLGAVPFKKENEPRVPSFLQSKEEE